MKLARVLVIVGAALTATSLAAVGAYLSPITLPLLWAVARSYAGAWRWVPSAVAGVIAAEAVYVCLYLIRGGGEGAVAAVVPLVAGAAVVGAYGVRSRRGSGFHRQGLRPGAMSA
jgi:hypothetical protein